MRRVLFTAASLCSCLAAQGTPASRPAVTEAPLAGLDRRLDETAAALEKKPRDPALLRRMAELCAAKARALFREPRGGAPALAYLEDAANFAGRCLEVAPGDAAAHRIRGLALLRLGRADAALAEARWLRKHAPGDAAGDLIAGEVYFARYLQERRNGTLAGEAEAVLAGKVRGSFHRAAILDPTRALPHRRLGDLAAWRGESETALEHYAEALARDPTGGAPLAWIEAHHPRKAVRTMLDRALERFAALGDRPPADAAPLNWEAGRLAFLDGDAKSCRRHMERAAALRPDWPYPDFYLGLAAWMLGEPAEAERRLAALARKDPELLAGALRQSGEAAENYADWIASLAAAAAQRGDRAIALVLDRGLALFRDSAADWNNVGFLLREMGRYEESLEAYERALAAAPNDPQVLNDLAVVLHYHLGRDLERARRLYERAIAEARRLLVRADLPAADRRRAADALANARANLRKLERRKR